MEHPDKFEQLVQKPIKAETDAQNVQKMSQASQDPPKPEAVSERDENIDQSSQSHNSEKKNETELILKNSSVLVRKRKAVTSKKIGSDKKSKNYDSDNDSKVQDMDSNLKAEFLYHDSYALPDLTDYLQGYIKIIVAREYLTNQNKAIIKRQIWGNEFYSSNSDIVCILQHCGAFKLQELPPKYQGLAVYFKVSRNRNNYASHFKNGVRSRRTQSFDGHSLKFETAIELVNLGPQEKLNSLASRMSTKRSIRRKQKQARKALESEQDMSIVFNLSGEPMNKFNLGEFGDRRHIDRRVSETIQKEVLYLETYAKRYEVSFDPHKKLYNVKEVQKPLLKDLVYMYKAGVPLPETDVKEVLTDLEWKEFLWGDHSLRIRDSLKLNYINGYMYIPIPE
ncbi:unnamed protein product [Moneuplotes crassus]|uniref:Uncharacterized protein n=1 Tax=Euplotes crassus TaxID=5936 RepID=A0AAD1UUD8_EUPCR|nr:unnamed protein product [Moneuplotes crassus]